MSQNYSLLKKVILVRNGRDNRQAVAMHVVNHTWWPPLKRSPSDSPFGPLRGAAWRPWAPGTPFFSVFVFPLPPRLLQIARPPTDREISPKNARRRAKSIGESQLLSFA